MQLMTRLERFIGCTFAFCGLEPPPPVVGGLEKAKKTHYLNYSKAYENDENPYGF